MVRECVRSMFEVKRFSGPGVWTSTLVVVAAVAGAAVYEPTCRPRSSQGAMRAMKRHKQVDSSAPIGTWSVHHGVISIMGITLAVAMAMAPTTRDLSVVELWAGVASVVGAAKLQNYKAAGFDLNRCPGVTDMPGENCEDITAPRGFKKAIMPMLRLREGGLLALGPDCSSFTFPNSSRHKRKVGLEVGDLNYEPVNVGNLMVVIALFLCQIALACRVHFALESPLGSCIFRFCGRVCPDFMNMVVADGVERSGRQGVHAQTVARCAYDEGPEPKIQKAYKWLATWPGIKGLNARCKCQQDHRTVGHTNSQGGWSGNLPLLAESASYPKKLGTALPTSWVQGCVAINAAWSNQAVALTWQGPRESVECLPAPEPKKVSNTSGLGPWDVIADAAEAAESGSTAVEPDYGPWSARNSHVQPSAPAATSPSNNSFGPWGGTASAGLSSVKLSWPLGIHRRGSRHAHIWPLGYCLMRNF